MSPSDLQTAYKAGCKQLKSSCRRRRQPKLRKQLQPLQQPRGPLCPTGGVSLDNMNDYLGLKEVFAIGGSWLATPAQIKAKE